MESPRIKTFEIILLIAVVLIGGGWWWAKKPAQVEVSPSPTATASSKVFPTISNGELITLGGNNKEFNAFVTQASDPSYSLVEIKTFDMGINPRTSSSPRVEVVESEPDSFVDLISSNDERTRIGQCGTVCNFDGAVLVDRSRIIMWGAGAACDLLPEDAPQELKSCDQNIVFITTLEWPATGSMAIQKRYLQFTY